MYDLNKTNMKKFLKDSLVSMRKKLLLVYSGTNGAKSSAWLQFLTEGSSLKEQEVLLLAKPWNRMFWNIKWTKRWYRPCN
jgi:hypothetical protein